jgi:glycosyl transferase family 25
MQAILVRVISLERSTDRRERVQRELKNFSLEWAFLNAVDGFALKALPKSYDQAKVRRLQGYELTPGEIGCYLSHMKAWEQCVEQDKTMLVLEDDFVINGDLSHVFESLTQMEQRWSLVRLAALYDVEHRVIDRCDGVELVENKGDPVGAAAYLTKPSAAAQLIKCSSAIYEPVDHYLEHYSKHGVSMHAVRPYPISIVGKDSTITDRSGRLPVKGFQKIKRSVCRLIDRKFSASPWFPKQ